MCILMKKYEIIKLRDVCSSISETYKNDFKYVVLVNTSDVLEGKILNHELCESKNLKGQFKKTFKKNDILYSEIRPQNKRYAFIDFDDTEKYIASTKLMIIRTNSQKILPEYLYLILKSKRTINILQYLAETRSGTFPQITFDSEVANLKIKLLNIEYQKKIISISKAIDDKIALNRKINDNLMA